MWLTEVIAYAAAGRVGHRLFAGVPLFILTPGMALPYPVQARGELESPMRKRHMPMKVAMVFASGFERLSLGVAPRLRLGIR